MPTFAFIPELISDDWTHLYIKLFIVGGCWIMVLIAMSVDLFFGIRKAKQIDEFITSEGYRRTFSKFSYYYAAMLFALIFDCIVSVGTYYLPFPLSISPLVSMLVCIGLVLTEFKSVREKAEDKMRRRTDSSFIELAKVLKDKDLLSKIYEQLAKEKESQNQNQ